jgi:hypothetical protein
MRPGPPALPIGTRGIRLRPRRRDSKRFRDLYKGRGAVERTFGRPKDDHGFLATSNAWAKSGAAPRGCSRASRSP